MKLADFMVKPSLSNKNNDNNDVDMQNKFQSITLQQTSNNNNDKNNYISNTSAESTNNYTVHGTKNCSVPLRIEKRRGRDITVISNIEGDVNLLSKELKKILGCSCAIRETGTKLRNIEIQGNHMIRVEKFLMKKQCFKGVQRKKKEAISNQIEKDQERKSKKKELKKLKDSKDVVRKGKKKTNINQNMEDANDLKLKSKSEIGKIKPKILKTYLKACNLSTQGNKKELIDRLYQHVNNPSPLTQSSTD